MSAPVLEITEDKYALYFSDGTVIEDAYGCDELDALEKANVPRGKFSFGKKIPVNPCPRCQNIETRVEGDFCPDCNTESGRHRMSRVAKEDKERESGSRKRARQWNQEKQHCFA